ncbi:hypothetical protein [Nocardioides sp.]|uniref:hypothetical protein n=1 Tax=Nocardioides sp. TaxID=35761 RepID=UPI002C5130C7|nr:hypothetical protein [Nocardioides sp.]HXH79568.1 hypothetical protein [Nocardioides sp.]
MTETSDATSTGRDAFDVVLGEWHVSNRKRVDMLDQDSDEWVEFRSRGVHRPLPGRAGNLETYETYEMPGVGEFHGLALRLYDPAEDIWRIWWSSSLTPGKLDPPLEGRFDAGRGTFVTDDVIAGRSIRVRFVWSDLGVDRASWEQAFSRDEGQTWDTNWVMNMTRAEG